MCSWWWGPISLCYCRCTVAITFWEKHFVTHLASFPLLNVQEVTRNSLAVWIMKIVVLFCSALIWFYFVIFKDMRNVFFLFPIPLCLCGINGKTCLSGFPILEPLCKIIWNDCIESGVTIRTCVHTFFSHQEAAEKQAVNSDILYYHILG